MKVAVVKETAPGERRVALVPDAVAKLRAAGLEVLVESGAGDGAWLADDSFTEAGASVVSREEALAAADAVVMVGRPDERIISGLHRGQALFAMLAPLADPALARELAAAGVTAVSLDQIPRTLPRAQSMDALSSQANIAGYKAALVGAAAFGRFFPMLITAAGTARPARVLVLGAGVAGLQAIGTARRLGAVVTAYDVRPETKVEVESLGATFIELTGVGPAAGAGGYARALTDDERRAQQEELEHHIARHDVVITTAQVPGRRPPLLVTAEALKSMAAGSVVVDMGASALGGNVAGSEPDQTLVTENGVTLIGAGSLPSTMPAAASAMYARNISSLLLYMLTDGSLAIDRSDDLQAGVVITHDGQVVHPALAEAGGTGPRAGAAATEAAEATPALADSAGGIPRVDGSSH
jgi:H+-translocating NAD(P) transhydrogenase subunit alpha